MTAPNGATVNVSDERAKVLVEQGYKAVSEKPKAPAKKAASSKSSDNK
ncbi:MAG: DUF7302 family protein [Aeromicrobium sp.]